MAMSYEVNKINDDLYYIDDEHGDSLYLILGSKKALLVDTGMDKEPLMPVLRQYTQLPIEVILTHAHIDHMYHVEEFEKVYIHENEKKYWWWQLWLCGFAGSLMYKTKYKNYDIKKMVSVQQHTQIDLGDHSIQVIEAFGHTPGSIVLVDEKNESVYLGDAVGSGQFSWMWLPGSLTLSKYKTSLIHLKQQLSSYGHFQFYGGHHQQAFKDCGQMVTLETIEDMIMLCDLVLSHEIAPIKKEKIMGITIHTYQAQRAAFVISKSKMK